MSSAAEELRARILALADEYHAEAFPAPSFVPGVSPVPVSGKVVGPPELRNLFDAALDLWLTEGRFADELETRLAETVGVRHAYLCNSGSSANLLAVAALLSPRLGDRRLRPGDEVVTVAAGFPTTVNPIVLHGLVPVFVDVELGTYDAQIDRVAEAIGPRTRAIVMAHTLGNPFDLEAVTRLAREHELFLVEDNCDALGARYHGRLTGTFGDLATLSFYPAHQMTTGEGGCVLTDRGPLGKIVESLRDWGRDCWCAPGVENTCGKRFEWQLGDLPYGYDHKYVYSHVGYNLKLTDSQASVGLAQLDRLPGFVAQRQAELATPGRRPRRSRGALRAAAPDAGQRAELVRVRADRAAGGAVHAQRGDRVPRGPPHRDAARCSGATSRGSPPTPRSSTASWATSTSATSSPSRRSGSGSTRA